MYIYLAGEIQKLKRRYHFRDNFDNISIDVARIIPTKEVPPKVSYSKKSFE